jgi:hypothetical protein
MSLPIWTPDALACEARVHRGTAWRLVEAQHYVSTLKLVDSLAEQDALEHLIEASKPAIPAECRHLDPLLATPFRYGAVYPSGSRFRRAGRTPGVFYAAERVETAVAEMAFYRLLFYAESPGTPPPQNATEYTAFAVRLATDRAIDLTVPPLSDAAAVWTDPVNYAPCQALADAARAAAIGAIRYRSVRDPAARANLAVLTCSCFAEARPVARQSWRLRIAPHGVQALREHPRKRMAFERAQFAADPRLSGV